MKLTQQGTAQHFPGYVAAQDYGSNQAALAAADAVAAAAGKQLLIGRPYSITSALTLAARVKFMPGAILTIATAQTLTINDTMEAGLYQIFEYTAFGGKVQFGGTVTAGTTNTPIVQAKWFGAKGDGTTDDYIPISKALKSLPPYGDGSLTWSGELVRCGVVHLSNGTYLTSDNILIGPGTTLEGEGVYHTTLKFTDGAAPSVEKFVVMVDRRGTLGANYTHQVFLRDMEVNGNRTNNAFSSGVQWYGAENNGLSNVGITDCSKRGLIIGGATTSGTTLCSAVNLSNVWVNNVTEGPVCSINSSGFTADMLAVQHGNDAGSTSVPGLLITHSNDVNIGCILTEEPSVLAVLVDESQNINLGQLSVAFTTDDSLANRIALKITGTSSAYISAMVSALRCNTLISDLGWQGGSQRNLTFAGVTTDWAWKTYTTLITAAETEIITLHSRSAAAGPKFDLTGIGNGTSASHTEFNASTTAVPGTYLRLGGTYFNLAAEARDFFGLYADSAQLNLTTLGSHPIVFEPNAAIALTLYPGGCLALKTMNTTARLAISAPVEGMVVFDSTLHTICFHNGTNWQKVTSSNAD
jgi:hypothetical protein